MVDEDVHGFAHEVSGDEEDVAGYAGAAVVVVDFEGYGAGGEQLEIFGLIEQGYVYATEVGRFEVDDLVVSVCDGGLFDEVFEYAAVLDFGDAEYGRSVGGEVGADFGDDFGEVLQFVLIDVRVVSAFAGRRKFRIPGIRRIEGVEEIFQVIEAYYGCFKFLCF